METMLITLFPEVQKKGLRLEMYYEDDFIGKITIESDGSRYDAGPSQFHWGTYIIHHSDENNNKNIESKHRI